jgi:hypothetical protein
MITTEMVLRAARELAVDQYVAGESVASICRRTGLKSSTFTDMLKRLGVYEPGRKAGPPLKEKCDKGHDMSVHGKPASYGQGRYCSECKRIRQRKSQEN